MAFGMLVSASRDAPTYDEVAHIAAGIAYVKLHDLRFETDHPPLVQLLASMPFRFIDVHLPSDTEEIDRASRGEASAVQPELAYGVRLLYESGNDPAHILWLARLPMIVLSLLFALVVFGFARDLFGNAGGLVALAVATLTPDLLAHGRLVNTDVAVAGFALTTAWFLWRAARGSRWWFAGAGAAFGAALASKHSALILIPPLLAVTAVSASANCEGIRRRLLRAAVACGAIVGIGFAVVWASYVVADAGLDYDRRNVAAESATGVMASVADRLPVPEPYRVGVRFRVADVQGERGGYLFGKLYEGGKVVFYPALLAVKTPLGIFALWIIGLFVAFRAGLGKEIGVYLLVIPGFFLLVAVLSQINIGVRHVLLVPLFMSVACGAVAHLKTRFKPAVAGGLLLAAAISVWYVFPSYLAYANEAFGGPNHLDRVASDSNLDWGQDLSRLREWMDRNHPGEPLAIAYFGAAPIDAYGFVDAVDLTQLRPVYFDGLVAVSASYYSHVPALHDYFRSIGVVGKPIARIGYSILIYRSTSPWLR
jgi:4-amino-4-deoxy-L-arabinose transferase-like glycosyltransferase